MGVFVLILEIIGTASFAASGAYVGIKKNMDLFGVSVLGLTAATGGGVIRDLLLGNFPPLVFKNPVYALSAIGVSLLCFVLAAKTKLFAGGGGNNAMHRLILVADSAGLGLFAVIGVKVAAEAAGRPNFFMTVFVGTVTAVGGGVMRDLLAGGVPFIFMKHIYATSALAGALVCALGWNLFGNIVSMAAGACLVFSLRLLAAFYKWNLPKVKTTDLPKTP